MQVTRKMQKLARKLGEISNRIQREIRGYQNRTLIAYDKGVKLVGTVVATFVIGHENRLRKRAEKIVETWDFGFMHGLFAAEDGYLDVQQRPEAQMPHRYAAEIAEIDSWRCPPDRLDHLTTGLAKYPTAERSAETIAGIEPIVAIKQADPNTPPGTIGREEQARQAEIDGFPGKAARLRGATQAEARKVESPVEKQARRNKARIDREFASGKRTSLI